MKKVRSIEEVMKMRFEDIYDRYQERNVTCEEAADLLGVSVSTFYRKRQRYEEEDFNGRFDRRLGKRASNRAADREVEKLTRLYKERYEGFSVRHFYEFARREHGVTRSYSWSKNKLMDQGLMIKSSRGGKHRLRRERKARMGMMVHQDGSTHRWIPRLDYDLDLIVTLDDATSEITSGFLIGEEGTESTLKGLKETIEKYGLFCSFYTDRGSHYFHTDQAGGRVDKSHLTQVGRALKQLGIEHIAAYSPEARGRSERMFGTLQNRLPKELALKHIGTIDEANRYIREVYIPRHNQQFTVKPKVEESAFIPWKNQTALDEILSLQDDRIVQNDNTVRYKNLILQIPKNEYRHQYIRAKVQVREYLDKTIGIFYGPLNIGRYDMNGNLLSREQDKTIKKTNKRSRESDHRSLETSVGLRPPSVSNERIQQPENTIGQLAC